MHEGRLETRPSCTVSRKQHFRCSSGHLSLRVSIIINVSIVQRTPTSTIKTSSDPTSNFQLPRFPRPAPNVQRSTFNVRCQKFRGSERPNVQRSSVPTSQRPNVPESKILSPKSNVRRPTRPTCPTCPMCPTQRVQRVQRVERVQRPTSQVQCPMSNVQTSNV